ncbi:MAG: hypothetical protein BRD49_04280, partial [Bacteroidetes bacterium SW_10_40_5]
MIVRLLIIVTVATLGIIPNSKAQIENNWVFGKYAGIDFEQSPPQTFTSNIFKYTGSTSNDTVSSYASSSISDCQGNLLFYTNGCRIWDSTHQVMNNGNLGCYNPNNLIEPLSTYIIPKPGSNNKYYVFYSWGSSNSDGFYYSIVDMSQANGKGSVKQKNQLIKQSTSTSYLTVVEHQNNKDYWLVFLTSPSNSPNSNYRFYAYPLTQNGIGLPVISHVNLYLGITTKRILKSTPNGQHLILNARSQIGFNTFITLRYDFDKNTGNINNKQGILKRGQVHPSAAYVKHRGIAVSPNNQLIYLNTTYALPGQEDQIYQVKNIENAPHQTALEIRKMYGNLDLQVAPNNKIYFIYHSGITQYHLGAIQNPNIRGTGCNVQDSVINVAPLKTGESLPRIYRPTPDINFKVKSTCKDTIE